jgi:lipopolysaccharide transport system permease protein
MSGKIIKYWQLIHFMATCDLKAESARAYLGAIWWYLEPLMYLSVFYLIKGVVFKGSGEEYVFFLLSGIVFWRWFDSSVRRALSSLLNNGPIMTQVYLPKLIFPCVAIVSMAYRFFILLGIFFCYLFFFADGISSTVIFMPVIMMVQLLFIVSVCILLSALVPFLEDLQVLISNLLLLMFFVSGVFFQISSLDPSIQSLLYLNPMAYIIDAYRGVIMLGVMPDISSLVYIVILSLVMLAAGVLLHIRFDRIYPKYV